MNLRQTLDIIQLRKPKLRKSSRVLDRCVTIHDLQREAHKYWPKGVRDYVEGGADEEVSLRRNRSAFQAVELIPSVLQGVGEVDLRWDILNSPSRLPIALGPTGFTRMMCPAGEVAAASAARQRGIPYTLSTMSTTSIETVAAVGGELWFQLYIWRDRRITNELLSRARQTGFHALIVTVDTPVTGMRVRDHHNGFTLPPRIGPAVVAGMALHPAWAVGMIRGEPITFANFDDKVSANSENIMEFTARQFDPSVVWSDLGRIRESWTGTLAVKGAFGIKDAVRARDLGVDALILSNHGGRQLDQAVSPIRILPAIRRSVGNDLALLIDSGIRHGTDIVSALALGADGCLIGRPYLYGLGAAGEPGCLKAIDILSTELTRAMTLLGVHDIAELRCKGSEVVKLPTL